MGLTGSIVTGLLLCMTGILLLDHTVLDRESRRFLQNPCPKRTNPGDCPAGCGHHGQCVDATCQCDDGFYGPDCSFEKCPLECTRRGRCVRGYCICEPRYGGADCSIDRLRVLKDPLVEGVKFDLSFVGGTCAFLTAEDIQRHGGDRTKYWSDITHRMETFLVPEDMQEVLPPECPQLRFNTCAVVGNSGNLRFAQKGPEIDAHEMVYRFNQAPTAGFEDFVGSKTTLESLNAKFAHRLRHEDATWRWRDPPAIYVMFEPFKLRETYARIRTQYPHMTALMFSPEFFMQAHHIYDRLQENLENLEFGCFTGEKPMSGFYAILFALATCDKVDLYGFDAWVDSMTGKALKRLRYHYFDGEEPRPGAHSFDVTYLMYELMASRNGSRLVIHSIGVPDEKDDVPFESDFAAEDKQVLGDNEIEEVEEEEDVM